MAGTCLLTRLTMFLCVFIHVLQHIHFRQNTHENWIFITKGVLYFTMKVARDKKVNLLVRHLPCISKVQNSCGLAPNVQACEAGTNVTLGPQFCTIVSFFSAGTLQKNCCITAIYEAPWKDEQIGAKILSWKRCEKMGGVVN